MNATQLSDELSSSLHNSGGTGDNLLPSSSQSAPDELDQSAPSAVDVDDNPLDTMPAVVQQPVSELRKETQPASSAPRAEIGEQKHQQDLIDDLALANGLSAKETDPISSTSELDPNLESQAKISALSALQESGADSTVSSDHSVAPSFNPDHAFSSALTSEPVSIPSVDHPDHPQVPVVEGSAAEAPLDPAPSPTEPSAPTLEKEFQSKDQLMQDIPQDSAKVAREREEDNSDEEPAAKRSKTEGTVSTDFKVPELPALNTQLNGTQMELPQPSDSPMTQSQHKYCLRIIQNVKRIQSSIAFRTPVDYVALKIPSYPSIIKRPMDLKTLEENLKGEKFPTVEAFIADFNQIVQNCETFNGRESAFTKAAYEMKASFDRNLVKMPGPDVAEASPAEKKKKKTVVPSTAKSAAPRRESRSSLPGSARSPISAGSPQTFALGPQGVPLIRRDSTLGDGRPKREIHPPAPRDLPYANQKPRKKKFQWELKFCEKVLNEISKPRYSQESWPFMAPVDPVALNIPSYHSIIKKPMDFGTMRTKLDHGEYENAKEFEADARLVFQNCYKFNPPSDVINQAGHKFENTFDHEWAKKREWIEANAPSSGPHSAGSSEAEDSDEEEEEDEVEEEEQTQLSKLQQQIAAMSRQVELITQKKKSPPVSGKKTMKGAKSVRKDTKKSAAPSKVEKKGHTRPAKKEKTPYVTYEQKQDISNRINSLSESKMATALKIIRDNMPTLKVRLGKPNLSFYVSFHVAPFDATN